MVRALDWGSRSREFESHHSDETKTRADTGDCTPDICAGFLLHPKAAGAAPHAALSAYSAQSSCGETIRSTFYQRTSMLHSDAAQKRKMATTQRFPAFTLSKTSVISFPGAGVIRDTITMARPESRNAGRSS